MGVGQVAAERAEIYNWCSMIVDVYLNELERRLANMRKYREGVANILETCDGEIKYLRRLISNEQRRIKKNLKNL